MGDFKTCDIHGKEFPANLIDTNKTQMYKIYVEQNQIIEGQRKTLTLFVGNNENEGVDTCSQCIKDKFLSILSAMQLSTDWKNVSWEQLDVMKKDGTGTYKKNTKIVKTINEVKADLQAKKKLEATPKAS